MESLQEFKRSISPIEGDGDQCKDRCRYGYVGHEIIDGAINRAKWPIRIQHEYKVEDTVQRGHQQVSDAQVQ